MGNENSSLPVDSSKQVDNDLLTSNKAGCSTQSNLHFQKNKKSVEPHAPVLNHSSENVEDQDNMSIHASKQVIERTSPKVFNLQNSFDMPEILCENKNEIPVRKEDSNHREIISIQQIPIASKDYDSNLKLSRKFSTKSSKDFENEKSHFKHPSDHIYRENKNRYSLTPGHKYLVPVQYATSKSDPSLNGISPPTTCTESSRTQSSCQLTYPQMRLQSSENKSSDGEFCGTRPKSHSLLQQERKKLESTMHKRLMASREMVDCKNPLTTQANDSIKNIRQEDIFRRDFVSSHIQTQSKNSERNQRRAEHNQAITFDLCEIVADLFLAELRLTNTSQGFDLQNSLNNDCNHILASNPSEDTRRESILSSIYQFITDLPIRYALGVETPAEVLLHMRLTAVARADEFKAAVHIVNLEDCNRNYMGCTHVPNSKHNTRLVTICCSDTEGLLEYITKLLHTGGSRVLDADVMTTADNIALDRFVVQMNGRLRIDKLQQYIETHLRLKKSSSRSSSSSIHSDEHVHCQSVEKSVPKMEGGQYSENSPKGSYKSIQKACEPLYFQPPESAHVSIQGKIEQEMQTAIPLSEIISSSSKLSLTERSSSVGGRFHRRSASASRTRSPPLNLYGSSLPRNLLEKKFISSSINEQTSGDSVTEKHANSWRGHQSLPEHAYDSSYSRPMPAINCEGSFPENSSKQGIVPRYENSDERTGRSTRGLLSSLFDHHHEVPMIPYDDLMLLDTLGNGRISTVYRAAWHDSSSTNRHVRQVALKVATINHHTGSDSDLEELRREADIATLLSHNNVCEIVGIASDSESFCLAYEFCEGGSLLSLLNDTSRCYEYLPIALDIANGMAYLHSRNVIHRDLKPSNILLTGDYRAKVADFGMSVANTGQELTAETGTYRWMAPEVIRHDSYSSNADVYSFGIVLWQLITREVPFATLTPVQTAYAVAEGHRPEIPSSMPLSLKSIIKSCWDPDSKKRPSFTYIAMALAEYAKMSFNPAHVGAQTVRIANEMLANVEGNSTVNVDFSTSLFPHRARKKCNNFSQNLPHGLQSEQPQTQSFIRNLPSCSYSSTVGLEF